MGENKSVANFCLSYLLTMVYLRYTRSAHLDIVAISWLAHSNSLISTSLSVRFPHILHTNAQFPVLSVSVAQYSSQGSDSETLRVSLRVSGSGPGLGWAKHHNTRDNGGFMPLASNEPRAETYSKLRRDGERKLLERI